MHSYVSQKGQDRWVIEDALPGLRGGFFIDLAASDGLTINNTIVLERDLGWTGIAIEPNPQYRASLRDNRTCVVCHDCIDTARGEAEFFLNGELGGIVADDTDNCFRVRQTELAMRGHDIVAMRTTPLVDILDAYGAPDIIHYFSFDVEGAETRILRDFPFSKYRFLTMTIERPTVELNTLLLANGYLFVRNAMFDTFYVHESLAHVAREPFEQVPVKDW